MSFNSGSCLWPANNLPGRPYQRGLCCQLGQHVYAMVSVKTYALISIADIIKGQTTNISRTCTESSTNQERNATLFPSFTVEIPTTWLTAFQTVVEKARLRSIHQSVWWTALEVVTRRAMVLQKCSRSSQRRRWSVSVVLSPFLLRKYSRRNRNCNCVSLLVA